MQLRNSLTDNTCRKITGCWKSESNTLPEVDVTFTSSDHQHDVSVTFISLVRFRIFTFWEALGCRAESGQTCGSHTAQMWHGKQLVYKVIRQEAALPSCHPLRRRMDLSIFTATNTWFLGPTWVTPSPPKNGLTTRSVFLQNSPMWPTHRQTTLRATSVAICRNYVLHAYDAT